MPLDTNVYSKIRTLSDYLRANQASDQQAEANDLKIKAAKQEYIGKALNMTTPENYSQVRANLVNEGLLDDNIAPKEYNQEWLNKAKSVYSTTSAASIPSAVQEYEYYSRLSPQDKEQYLLTKRTNAPLNLGSYFAERSPVTNEVVPIATIQPKLSEMPDFKAEQAKATERAKLSEQLKTKPSIKEAEAQAAIIGKTKAETQDLLASIESKMPQLEKTVKELSDLGKKATYTTAGRLSDVLARETGQKMGEGAVARAEYISKIDNQILPLLRDTFGAQFTQKEGESLRATLGDVNKSPEEKDAVLNSFIQQKKRDVEALKLKRKLTDTIPAQSVTPDDFNQKQRALEILKARGVIQ